ncbi:MAG: helix-turn-helix transcriptional regulator [Clostridia bacterium]|nr:helix-turn-helix transcriptional regulator [Clostridia bacterium]
MPVQYKINVLEALKEAGYTTYKIRKENLLGQSVLQQLRKGELVSWANISRLCDMLNCQPGDLLKHIPEQEGESV